MATASLCRRVELRQKGWAMQALALREYGSEGVDRYRLIYKGDYANDPPKLSSVCANTCIRSNLHSALESDRYVVGEKSRLRSQSVLKQNAC